MFVFELFTPSVTSGQMCTCLHETRTSMQIRRKELPAELRPGCVELQMKPLSSAERSGLHHSRSLRTTRTFPLYLLNWPAASRSSWMRRVWVKRGQQEPDGHSGLGGDERNVQKDDINNHQRGASAIWASG